MDLKTVKEVVSMSALLKPILQNNIHIHAEQHFYGKNSRQYYLYFPPKGEVKKKVIIYVHGGGWCMFSASQFKYIGDWFAQKGYATISIGYRHSPHAKYPAQGEDVFCGLSKAIELLNEKGIPTTDIVLVGSSAGGHLCGILAYDKLLQKKYGIDASCLKGFVSLGGILHFDVPYAKSTYKLFNKLFFRKYDIRQASPYYLATGKENIKTLCIHSSQDPTVSVENVVAFHEKMTDKHCTLYIEQDKKYFHSNLVAGIFCDLDPNASQPLKVLYDWICTL